MFRRLASPLRTLVVVSAFLVGAPGVASSQTLDDEPDLVRVYYGVRDCPGEQIDVEIWDRENEGWIPHPEHPRVTVPSCRTEDAGYLLNELRWRCRTPSDEAPWRAFRVFDPEVMSRCAVGQVEGGTRTHISVTSPALGTRVRAPESHVTVTGSVLLDGLDGSDYDLLFLVDRSAPAGALEAQVAALRSLVARFAPRGDELRFAIVSYPNLPPGRGEATGARRELDWTADPKRVDAALARLARRPVEGLSTPTAALDAALALLDEGRPAARPVLVMGLDGALVDGGPASENESAFPLRAASARAIDRGAKIHWVALGGVAADPPEWLQRSVVEGRGSFRRVMPHEYGTPVLANLQLPVTEAVWVDLPGGMEKVDARVDRQGRFRVRVPVVGGENEFVLRARTSDGDLVERPFHLHFDDGLVRRRLLEEERARMRAAQGKELEIRAEEEGSP